MSLFRSEQSPDQEEKKYEESLVGKVKGIEGDHRDYLRIRGQMNAGAYENAPQDGDSHDELSDKVEAVNQDLETVDRLRARKPDFDAVLAAEKEQRDLKRKVHRQYFSGLEKVRQGLEETKAKLLASSETAGVRRELQEVERLLADINDLMNNHHPGDQEYQDLWDALDASSANIQNLDLFGLLPGLDRVRTQTATLNDTARQRIEGDLHSVEQASALALEETYLALAKAYPRYHESVLLLPQLEILETGIVNHTIPPTDLSLWMGQLNPGLLQIRQFLATHPHEAPFMQRLPNWVERGERALARLQPSGRAESGVAQPVDIRPIEVHVPHLEDLSLDDIRHLNFFQLDALIRANALDPYEGQHSRITNPKEKELVIQYQDYSKQHTAEIAAESPEEKAERIRLKVDMFCFRYNKTHSGPEAVPMAKPEDLPTFMETTNTDLERDDILAFMKNSLYGEQIGVLMKFIKYITSRRPADELVRRRFTGEMLKKFSPPASEQDNPNAVHQFMGISFRDGEHPEYYLYKTLIERKKSSDKLHEYLKQKFVLEEDCPYRMPEKVFETAWAAYYTFGGFETTYSLQEKWSQTRSHMTALGAEAKDRFARSRPLHEYAHNASRYGGWKNWNGWLLAVTTKYPDLWVASHPSKTSDGKRFQGVQEAQKLVKTFLESYYPLDGIENMVYPNPKEEDQKENFVRFWNSGAYEERYKMKNKNDFDFEKAFERAKMNFVVDSAPEEIQAQLTPLHTELNRIESENKKIDAKLVNANSLSANEVLELRRTKAANIARVNALERTILPVVQAQYNVNFEELWYNMWDLSVFPDQLEYLTEGLGIGGSVVSQGNFDTASKGWASILNLTRGPIHDDKPITYEDFFKQNGLFDKFVGQGLGLAKLVEGRHKRWFVPLMRMYLGNVAAYYQPRPGQSDTDARIEMAGALVKRLSAAIDEGEGLKGLDGFSELRDELMERGKIYNDILYKGTKVPPLLRNAERERSRFKKYREYVILEHEERTEHSAPIGLRRWFPFGSGTMGQRKEFRRNFRDLTHPEGPLSRVPPPEEAKK